MERSLPSLLALSGGAPIVATSQSPASLLSLPKSPRSATSTSMLSGLAASFPLVPLSAPPSPAITLHTLGERYKVILVGEKSLTTSLGELLFAEHNQHVLQFARPGDIVIVSSLVALPFITCPTGDEQACVESLIRCVNENREYSQERVTVRQLIELYRHMQMFHLSRHPNLNAPEECLSHFAYLCHVCDRDIAAEDVMRGYNGKVFISPNAIQAIFAAWHDNQDVRLLRVLGLKEDLKKDDEAEIRSAYMPTGELYARLLSNPFLVHSLTTVRAEAVAQTLGHRTTDFDIECSRVLSKLHASTIGSGDVFARLDSLKKSARASAESMAFLVEKELVYISGNRIYLRQLYDMEKSVAARMAHIVKSGASVPRPVDLSCLSEEAESDGRTYTLDFQQKAAVVDALTGDSGMCVIIGCAGSGKTTMIQKMVKALSGNKIDIATIGVEEVTDTIKDTEPSSGLGVRCTSFTGQATSNIQKKVGISCENEHTMITVRRAKFSYLIIDEFSMQSLELTYYFFLAFPHDFRLIVVGDPNQLQPLSFGDMLSEVIASNTVPVHELKQSYRVLVKDGVVDCIIENANRISFWGKTPGKPDVGVNFAAEPFKFILGDNFKFIDEPRPSEMIKQLVGHVVTSHRAGVQAKDFVIISPYTEEIIEMNRMVQQIYLAGRKCMFRRLEQIGDKQIPKWKVYQFTDDPQELALRAKERREWLLGFYVGDLVRCTKNSHRNKIFNGNEGIVIDVAMAGVTARFKLADGPKDLVFPVFGGAKELTVFDLSLAYAATTHLMQGAQRPKVIGYFHKVTPFVDRPNIYVLFTRASSEVLFIGNKNLVQKAVNNLPRPRNNTLAAWLTGLLPQLAVKDADTRMQEEILAVAAELVEELKEYGIREADDGDGGDICDFD